MCPKAGAVFYFIIIEHIVTVAQDKMQAYNNNEKDWIHKYKTMKVTVEG